MIENLDIKTTGIDNIEGYNQINSILSKITFSGTDGTEYPAIIKGLKNVWEVKDKMQGGYDPFQVIQDIINFDNKAVSLSSKEPDKENWQQETEKKEDIKTPGINNTGISLDTALSNIGVYDALNSIEFASGKINPEELVTDIAKQTTLKLKNSWNIDKFTGQLSAFNHKCPICGKTVKYIPLNGYCSLECFLKDAEAQIKGLERSVNSQLKKWTKQNIDVVANYLRTTLAYINEIPMLMAESASQLPDEMVKYIQVRLNYFSIKLKILTNRILIWKNNLIIAWLVEYQLGVCDKKGLNSEEEEEEKPEENKEPNNQTEEKPEEKKEEKEPDKEEKSEEEEPEEEEKKNWVDKMDENVDNISNEIFTDIFEERLDIDKILKGLDAVTDVLSQVTRNLQFIIKLQEEFEAVYPQLKKMLRTSITQLIPSDSFGFVATTRAKVKNPSCPNYIDISYPCSVNYPMPQKSAFYEDLEKKALSRPKIQKIKSVVDKVVNYSFPPIQEFEYLMSPQLFAIRLVMSDQNVTAIAKNVKNLLLLCQGEPDLMPKYEDMKVSNIWWLLGLMKSIVPTVQFAFGKITPPGIN